MVLVGVADVGVDRRGSEVFLGFGVRERWELWVILGFGYLLRGIFSFGS